MSPSPPRPRPTAWLSSRHRAHARPRGRLLSGFSVALAAVGCAPPGPQAALADVEPLRRSVDVGPPLNDRVSYLQAGAPAGTRVILVHGTPGSASSWADYLLQPPAGLELVALDRPGFGDSGATGARPSMAEQAAAVEALLPADGRPVVLLGHSLGGPVVAQVAANHPGRIQGVVLLAASLDPGLEEIHLLQHVGRWPMVAPLLPRALRHANDELMALKPELEALALQLPRITAKVVIVHGTADDLVPVANVLYVQQRLTGARCVQTLLLDGRNHFLPWNSAQAVMSALRDAAGHGCLP